jgi:hypothetical protein
MHTTQLGNLHPIRAPTPPRVLIGTAIALRVSTVYTRSLLFGFAYGVAALYDSKRGEGKSASRQW